MYKMRQKTSPDVNFSELDGRDVRKTEIQFGFGF